MTSLLSNELLSYLDKLYPEASPSPSWSDREIWMAVGARQLVRGLHAAFNEVNTDNVVLNQL